jgi:hypothetical protein
VRALDRIERICAKRLGAKALREQVLAELRKHAGFDAHVWLLTDPVTRVCTSPLADVPGLEWTRLPQLGRARYLTPLNRWTDLMDAGRRAAVLSIETDGDLARSRLWAEVLHDLGVADVASAVFWDRFGCWAWLDLWRFVPAKAFDADDADFLDGVVRVVTPALRRAQAQTFVDDPMPTAVVGPAIVVLDPDLNVLRQTAGAEDLLQRLNPPDEPMPAIPAAALNVAAALVAEEAGVPVGPPRSRVHVGGGRWLTLRADRLDDDVAVTIESSTPAERMEVFALANGLSAREREVLSLLAGGADSRHVAARLVVSEHMPTTT